MFSSLILMAHRSRPCTILRNSSKTRLRVKNSDCARKAWNVAENCQNIILSVIFSLTVGFIHFIDNPLILSSKRFISKLHVHSLICVIEEGAHNPKAHVKCTTILCTFCSHGNGHERQ